MNPVTKEAVLGFYDDLGFETIFAKEGDTERRITFQLVDELSDYALTDTTFIFFRERFSNGMILLPQKLDKDSSLSSDGTELTLSLTDEMLLVSGLAYCDLTFIKCDEEPEFDENGKLVSYDAQVLSTQTFKIFIGASPYEDGNGNALDQNYEHILLPIVIKLQAIEKHDEEYTANEEIRKENETARISAENTRVSQESTRQSNETARKSAETSRVNAESRRASAETTRANAEAERVTNESSRISAENIRISNENSRVAAEISRRDNETFRISEETSRATSETLRRSAEEDRIAEEDNRIASERLRASNESTRVDQESDRVAAETLRETAEENRAVAEEDRELAEAERNAREGSGNYSSPIDMSYTDASGTVITIPYQDSRKGITERMLAIADGGSFMDSEGNVRTMVNEYKDLDGNTVPVSDRDLEGMSAIAAIVYARYLAGEAAVGIDQAMQAAESAEQSKSAAETAAQAALSSQTAAADARDTAVSKALEASNSSDNAETSKNAAADSAAEALATLNEVKDVMNTLNEHLVLSIDNEGHLQWEVHYE